MSPGNSREIQPYHNKAPKDRGNVHWQSKFSQTKYGRSLNLWVVENLLFTNKHAMGIKYDKLIHTIDVPKTAFNAPSDPIINVPMIMQRTVKKDNA